MAKTAFMFSGQGAQFVGMGKALYDKFPESKAIFDQAEEALGFSVADLCFTENEQLNQTEYTQPAILTASIAAYAVAKDKPDYMLGLSLGEYSALVASGALDFKETVALVRTRGRLMTEACPPGTGAMSAVLNLSRELVQACCEEASALTAGYVAPANYNMPGQIVIAGEVAAVEKAEALCLEKGAKRCMRLNVSGAFHTALLAPAAEKLKPELDKLTISPMEVPVLTNLTGQPIASEADIIPTLTKQVMSPVEWEAAILWLLEQGVTQFVEFGPGKTLCGFVKKIAKAAGKEAEAVNIEETL